MLLALALAPTSAQATTYFNWLQNPSFSQYENFIEDGGAESNSYSSGVTYGNFTGTGAFSGTAYSGSYSFYLASSNYMEYHFAGDYNGTLGADVESFNFYTSDPTSYALTVRITYTDSSYDETTINDASAGWVYQDLLSLVDETKNLVKIKWSVGSIQQFKIDVIQLEVDTGNMQDEVTMTTSPWFWGGTYPSTTVYLTDSLGRLDDTSVRLAGSSTYRLFQSVDYLSANDVQFIDAYVYSAQDDLETYPVGITCTVLYADTTTDTKTVYLDTANATWEYVNFGKAFLDTTRYITQIRFSIADQPSLQTIYVDDLGLWSTDGAAGGRFTWNTSPSPVVKTSIYAECYQEVTYTFYGYVTNASGALAQNGTALVTTSNGQTTATITLGEFNFTLAERSGSTDIYETVGVILSLDDPEVLTASLNFKWTYVQGGSSSGSGSSGTSAQFEMISNFLGIFIVVFVPALALGGILASNPQTQSLTTMGVIAGLCVGGVMGVVTSYLPSWALIFIGMGVFLLIWMGKK